MDNSLYHTTFQSFLKRTNEKEKFIDNIRNLINLKSIKSILSVGVGDGSLDLKFKNLFPNIETYDVIEPMDFHYRNLHNKFNRVYKTTIENFDFNRKYDMILLSHVVYYFDDLKLELIRLLNNCKTIILYIQSEKTFTYCLQKKYDSTFHSLTSTNCMNILNELKLNYKLIEIDCEFDLTNLDNNTIDFILGKKLTDDEINVIMQYIKSNWSGPIIKYPNHIIVIS